MRAQDARVNDLIGTVEELVEVMDHEVQLVRAMRARDVADLQARKLRLIDAYERFGIAVKTDRAIIETLDPILRAELRDVLEGLQAAIRNNEAVLRAAAQANERLLRTIVETVQQHASRPGYDRLGATPARAGTAPVSLQVDRRL